MSEKVSRTRVLAALIAAPSVKMAAKWCGVSERTMHVMAREPEIADGLARARQTLAEAAMQTVLRAVTQAVAVLEEIMQDKDAAPMPRVIAAKALLDGAMRAAGMQDTGRRLDALEQRLCVPVIIDDLYVADGDTKE